MVTNVLVEITIFREVGGREIEIHSVEAASGSASVEKEIRKKKKEKNVEPTVPLSSWRERVLPFVTVFVYIITLCRVSS